MNLSRKKLLIILLLIVGAGVILAPQVSHASCDTLEVGCYISSAIAQLIFALVDAILWFLNMLIGMLTGSIRWIIEFGSQIMSLPIVRAGFKVSLNLVNLMFVMGLIISAFQIILGVGDHDAKGRIKNVIIAALLVNFSFLIAGFLLDISNVFTNYFLSNFSSADITRAFSLDNLTAVINPNGRIIESFGDLVTALPIALFSVGLTVLVVGVLVATFATALIRTLWVTVLLAVMPLAWGMMVFPGLSKYSSKWWEKFIEQGVTVLPTLTFFLFLTVSTASALKTFTSTVPEVGVTSTWNVLLTTLVQMCVLGGFLIGGLKMSQSAGAISATAALGAGKKTAGFLSKPITSSRWGKALGRSTAGAGSKILTKLNNVPVVGGVSTAFGLGAAAGALGNASHPDHDIEEKQKSLLSGLSDAQLFAFKARGAVEQAAKLSEIAKRKKTDEFTKSKGANGNSVQELKEMANAYSSITHKEAKDIAAIKEVASTSPILAKQLGVSKTIEDAVKKARPEDIAKWDTDVLENDEVMTAVKKSKTALRAIAANGSEKLKEKLNEQIGLTSTVKAQLEVLTKEKVAIETKIAEAIERKEDKADIKVLQDERRANKDARTNLLGGEEKRERIEYVSQVIDGKINTS